MGNKALEKTFAYQRPSWLPLLTVSIMELVFLQSSVSIGPFDLLDWRSSRLVFRLFINLYIQTVIPASDLCWHHWNLMMAWYHEALLSLRLWSQRGDEDVHLWTTVTDEWPTVKTTLGSCLILSLGESETDVSVGMRTEEWQSHRGFKP